MSSDLQLAFLDAVMVAVAYTSLLLFRFEFTVPTEYWERFRYFLPAVIAVHLVANRIWGCYGHMWQHASIQEARRLLLAGATAEVVIVVGFSFSSDSMPISVRAVGPLFATALMGAMRFQTRLFAIRRSTSRAGLRVVVIGAGRAGGQLVREMQHNDTLGLVAVAVVDDDRRWWGRTLYGVRVEGGLDDLERVVRDHEAHQVMLAIPSGGPEVARRVAEAAAAAGVPVKVLPSMEELIGGQPRLRDARDLSIDDLLSRDQVDIDTQEVAKLLRGRRVLVTGGGGWIGAEIARQVSTFAPAAIVLVDHDETHLFEAAQTVPEAEQALADIRDTAAIDALFARVQPDVVFHAAAHKHVPILESFAVEAATTNVVGTQNVVDAAVRHGDRAARDDLHRQGGRAHQRHGRVQVARGAGRARPHAAGPPLLRGAVRQRARQPGQRDPDVPAPDRRRRPGDGHRQAHDPVLHEHRARRSPSSSRPPPSRRTARSSCSRWASR